MNEIPIQSPGGSEPVLRNSAANTNTRVIHHFLKTLPAGPGPQNPGANTRLSDRKSSQTTSAMRHHPGKAISGPGTGVFRFCLICLAMILLFGRPVVCECASGESGHLRAVVDQRNVNVMVPARIDRVVAIDDGLVEGVLTALGVQDAVVGLGSWCIPRKWEFTYPTVGGESYTYKDGMNTVTFLNPRFLELPFVADSGAGINYETLAGLRPDVVILREGSCALGTDAEKTRRTIQVIESLGIPLIVLRGPDMYDCPNPGTLSEEIRIIGRVFDLEARAKQLAAYLEEQVQMVWNRTRDIPDSEKPRLLLLGLSPTARKAGGAGHVRGSGTMESFFVEELAHAVNAYQNKGAWNILGTEQILALDPDVIVLMTSWGYHPPRELYEAPYYQNLKELRAVRNRRVSALPWTPCNCQKRLEYPIDVMVIAKAAYPGKFADIDLSNWLLDFYQKVYGVERATAEGLRAAQWMDWTGQQ